MNTQSTENAFSRDLSHDLNEKVREVAAMLNTLLERKKISKLELSRRLKRCADESGDDPVSLHTIYTWLNAKRGAKNMKLSFVLAVILVCEPTQKELNEIKSVLFNIHI